MGLRSVVAFVAIVVVAVSAVPLVDIFNVQNHFSELLVREHEKITNIWRTLSGHWSKEPEIPSKWPLYPTNPGYPTYPGYPQYPTYPPYPVYPQYPASPQYPWYPPINPDTGYPSKPTQVSKPYIQGISHSSEQSMYTEYPTYPPYQQGVVLKERYFKLNDDGSKEYKLILTNGMIIYQKILYKDDEKQTIKLLEGYYSDKRDDGKYLITYFRANDHGYSASSETRNSPPSYPDIKDMIRLSI